MACTLLLSLFKPGELKRWRAAGTRGLEDPAEIYPYGFAQTSGELDAALEALSNVFHDMLELAEVEKTMQLLAEDIEKTRRRVNALEYVMIPGFQEKIRYISMKLDENERGNITRLMKVKDMVLQEAHEFQQPAQILEDLYKIYNNFNSNAYPFAAIHKFYIVFLLMI